MAWLGEEMEEKSEDALAPRCVKDVIEEKLFDQRRDLFADLSAVFMDTTSLSFYGEGGETLGEHGYSKDYRPDLKQMILALIVDGPGGRSAPRCGRAIRPTSPRCCRSSIVCVSASPSAASASSPIAA